jgi:Immunity protein 26
LKRPQYEEGTWFAVPLRDGGYGVGLVARKARRGVLLGYFFGPRRRDVPKLADVEELTLAEAILVKLFGDLGLLEGSWPIIGRSRTWNRKAWPLPTFGRLVDFTGRALRIEYSEDNLPETIREIPVSREEIEHLPEDGLSGAGSIEILLSKRLRAPDQNGIP